MTTHFTVNDAYFCSKIQGTPLLPNLADLQENGHGTLEEYLDYCFTQNNPLLTSFTLLVIDDSFYAMKMTIRSVYEKRLAGFWQTPCCNLHCEKERQVHPCITSNDSGVDCDMLFCAGASEDDSDYNTVSRNLNRHLLSCTKDRRGELTSCGIQDIVLHHQKKPTGNTMVSIELTVGCSSPESQSTFIIECHDGLIFSLK